MVDVNEKSAIIERMSKKSVEMPKWHGKVNEKNIHKNKRYINKERCQYHEKYEF